MRFDELTKCAGYAPTLDKLVLAFLQDRERRERAVREGVMSNRTLMEYRYIDYRILDAAEEIVGDMAERYIHDIVMRVGYADSEVSNASECTYKLRKLAVKQNIARGLHLID